jgi:hypothetical protein
MNRKYHTAEQIVNKLRQAEALQLLAALTDEKQKLKKEMDKTYQLYLDEQITQKGFGKRYKPMEDRLEQIDEQTSRLQAEISYLKVQYASSDEIINEARDLYSRWPNLARAEKRQIIEDITEKVVVGEKEVTISLCYLPFFPKTMAEKERSRRDSFPPYGLRCPAYSQGGYIIYTPDPFPPTSHTAKRITMSRQLPVYNPSNFPLIDNARCILCSSAFSFLTFLVGLPRYVHRLIFSRNSSICLSAFNAYPIWPNRPKRHSFRLS